MQSQSNEQFKAYLQIKKSIYTDDNVLIEKLVSILKDITVPNPISTFIAFNTLNEIDIFEIIGIAYQNLKQEKLLDSTNYRKHHGIYYTNYSIARVMAKEAVKDLESNDLENIKFYEPCVGGGIFLIAYIDEMFSIINRKNKITIKKIIDNIYFSDIDPDAINLVLRIVPAYIQKKYGYKITFNENNYHIGNVLFTENSLGGFIKVNPKEIFNIPNGFDIVLTNPPYRLLKTSSNKYSKENYLDNKILLNSIRKSHFYKYNQGTLNLYKIFTEVIIEEYLNNTGKAGLLIPSGLLKDKQSENLRKRIVIDYALEKIYLIPEKNYFFNDITQDFCFFIVDKNKKSNVIEIVNDVINTDSFNNKGIKILKNQLLLMSETLPIVSLCEKGWNVINKLSKFEKIKNIKSINNYRGELDLTLNKNFICTGQEHDTFPLLKGVHISKFIFKDTDFFCNKKFIKENKSKKTYVENERIACQQISNISQNSRLKFALIPPNTVLGNSCNFISVANNNSNISLLYLLGILNSNLLNWRFKVTNSNNHISNYEIDELPIKIPTNIELLGVEKKVMQILNKENTKERFDELNSLIYKIYKLDKSEIDYINNN